MYMFDGDVCSDDVGAHVLGLGISVAEPIT